MAEQLTVPVRAADLRSVGTRVSWGAIFAGVFVALAAHVLLGLLGAALGLSLAPRLSDRELTIGTVVWTVGVTVLALFLGGWTASRCTAGENRLEALTYGVIVWGVLFSLLLYFAFGGLRMGLGIIMERADFLGSERDFTNRLAASNLNRAARNAGLTQEQLDRLRNELPENVEDWQAVGEGETAARRQEAAWVNWVAFGAVLGSLLASVAGALIGSGRTPVFR
jgi:hypothetical protein